MALLFQDIKEGDKEDTEKEGHDLSHRFTRVAAWHEPNASFDGLAVRWGIGHFQPSAAACAAACARHEPVGTKRGGPFGALPCNAFVWCPADVPGGACFEPDAHAHGAGDCWLKFTETPEAPQVNQRARRRRVYKRSRRFVPRETQGRARTNALDQRGGASARMGAIGGDVRTARALVKRAESLT